MARSQPGESKAPLVISLAFFVLLTLGLGVMTYLAYGDIDKMKGDMKKAEDDKKNAMNLMTTEEEKKLLYKGALGLLTADEQGKLQSLRQKEAVREEYRVLVDGIDRQVQNVVRDRTRDIRAKDPRAAFDMRGREVFEWDWPADGTLLPRPKSPLAEQVVNFYAAQRLGNIENSLRAEASKAAQDKATERTKDADDLKARYQKELNDLPGKIAEGIKKHDDELARVRKDYQDEVKKFNDERQKWAAEKDDLQLKERQANERFVNASKLANQYEAKLETKDDPFAFDQPHGKILSRRDDLVDIDLGSADNLKTGMKFSVQPPDTPQKGFGSRRARDGTVMAKAKLEVIQITGPHRAQARLIDEVDRVRNSVLVGDLLYNSVWRKGEPDHIALFGVFDLNGDGTDDIKNLTRDLTRAGIVVDAYFDLDQRKWAGKLTEKTIYAVEGNTPFKQISAGEPPAVMEAKGQLLEAIEKARTEAKNRGTKVVKMRDFFPRTGIPVKLDVDEKLINQAAARYLKVGGESAQPPAEKN